MRHRVVLRLLCLALLTLPGLRLQATPPVLRSTHYSGSSAEAVSYPASSEFTPAGAAMTIEAWVYREDATRCETIVAQGFTKSYWLGFCPKLRFYRGGGIFADADASVPARQWTHVAASYDGTRVRFYIDGLLAGDKALSAGPLPGTGGLTLGADFSSAFPILSTYPFKGYLDEVRLWNGARSATQIQSQRFSELSAGAGLIAAFADGATPSTPLSVGPAPEPLNVRLSGFGILPSRLMVPRGAFPITLDGTVEQLTEYDGAEQVVIRYSDGAHTEDGVVYLINAGTLRSPVLHLATSSLKYPAVALEQSGLGVYWTPQPNPGSPRDGNAWSAAVPFSGTASGVRYLTGGFTLPLATGFSTFSESRQFCRTEFDPPCIEMKIQSPLVGTNRGGRLLLQHYGVGGLLDIKSSPGLANIGNPGTWAEVTFIDQTNSLATLAAVYVDSPVEASWDPTLRDYMQRVLRAVSVYSGDSAAGGSLIATFRPLGGDGWLQFPYPPDRNVTLKFELEPWDTVTGFRYQVGSGYGNRMVRTNRLGEYVLSPCTNNTGRCTLGFLTLGLLPDLGRLGLTGLSTNQVTATTVVRQTPRKVHVGEVLRIFGTNLHDQVQVYASTCPQSQLIPCLGTGDTLALEVVARDLYRGWVDVRFPELDRSWWGRRPTVWVRDVLRDRDGFGTEWNSLAGESGQVLLVAPIFAKLHGFEFINMGNFTSPEEFEATYGESVFTYIPLPPFKVRDPYYYGFWWWIFLGLSDISDSGSCHGFAATSQLYANGMIPLAKFDRGPSGAPTAASYANGFYGLFRDGERIPFGAPQWSGFDFFKAYEPVNLWAQIRVYMMAQFSDEALGNTISQIRADTALGSDPVEQLARIGSRFRDFILCFNPGGIGTGHCVTPYGVISEMGLDPTSTFPVPKAGYRLIKLYDNNWPEEERYMEIAPRSAGGRFTYRLGSRTVWTSHSLTRTPLSLFTGARHAPGGSFVRDPDLLYRLVTAQGVRVEVESAKGSRLGWNASGVFQDAYPGAAVMSPWAGFDTNRERSALMAVLPATNPPSAFALRVSTNRYAFHLGQDQLAIQLIASNAVPGTVDRTDPLTVGGVLQGIRFRAQSAHDRLTPLVCQTLPGTNRWVFRLDGLRLSAGSDLDFLSLGTDKGIRVVNRTGSMLRFALKVDALNGESGETLDSVFEGIEIPGNATADLDLAGGEGAGAGRLRFRLDLGRNGTVDQQLWVPAEYVLVIRRTPAGAVAEWHVREGEATLQTSAKLVGAEWKRLEAKPAVNGTRRSVQIPAEDAQGFFRLVR